MSNFRTNTKRENLVNLFNNKMIVGRPYTYKEVSKLTSSFKSGTVSSVITYLKALGHVTIDSKGNMFRINSINDKKVREYIASYSQALRSNKSKTIKKVTDLTEQEFNDINIMLNEAFDIDFITRVTDCNTNKVEDVKKYKNYTDYSTRFESTVNIRQLEFIMSQLVSIQRTVNATISILKVKEPV